MCFNISDFHCINATVGATINVCFKYGDAVAVDVAAVGVAVGVVVVVVVVVAIVEVVVGAVAPVIACTNAFVSVLDILDPPGLGDALSDADVVLLVPGIDLEWSCFVCE